MIKRRRDWRVRLAGFIDKVREKPPANSETFCAYFVANAVKEMTGTDLAKGFRGLRTLKAVQASFKKAGYASHIDRLTEQLDEIPPATAYPGDIALLSNGAFGVVQGEYVYCVTEQGIALVASDSITRAFRVPLE